ncbi:hypothetical protein [Dactylosporangium darangshiense]|uniref:Uncharacterized protein n=1 Tax=Dactylosporangium darangshiense TaxID=579108 RepID=A0ABP8DMV3_9ACTN
MDQGNDVPSRCLARLQLSAEETEWLTNRPHGAHEVPAEQCCHLEMGHLDAHAAMAQQSKEAEWWVRWTLSASEIVVMAGCPALAPTAVDSFGDPLLCLLYLDHPGQHSFELAPRATTRQGRTGD